jgi:CHAT domain-containing protein
MVKSRALAATLSTARPARNREDGGPDARFDDISHRLDALEYASYTGGETPEIQQQRKELLAARIDLVEKARYSDPRWRLMTQPVAFELNDLFDLLYRRKQAALTLFYQPGQIIAVLVKDKKCSVSRVTVSSGPADALTRYQDNLHLDTPETKIFDPSTSLNLKADDLVPSGIMESALQSASLIIAPHGPLHLLPWAGLIFKGKRLFQHCPVSIVPNLNCLTSLKTNFLPRPKVALIGAPDYSSTPGLQPLDLVSEELQSIKEAYSSEGGIIGDIIKGKNATEKNFWQLATDPASKGNVLHVSCHGNFKTDDPMNSGLLMADGKADASEISRAKIHYDEVVLSACCTGLRPVEVRGVALTGDDCLGLPGAFLEAGVRSVLVSIPPAREDAALNFMTIYHENRAAGHTPMAALQETQKTMLSEARFDPCLWIGMTVYGCQ